jgi:hypothetical protein
MADSALSAAGVSLASLGPPDRRCSRRSRRLPRELDRDEVTALLQASDESSRLVVLPAVERRHADEAIAARGRRRGSRARDHPCGGRGTRRRARRRAALGARHAHAAPASDPLLGQAVAPSTRESIDAQILCAAHDAGLDGSASVDADSLRHTYVAYLVRRGFASPISRRSSASFPPTCSARTRRSRRPGRALRASGSRRAIRCVRANVAGVSWRSAARQRFARALSCGPP